MSSKKYRLVHVNDARALAEIYRPFVESTAVSFETVVPTAQEFESKIRSLRENYPFLVCEMNNEVVGYIYAQKPMSRAAYAWNVELSLYIDLRVTGQKIGTKLLAIMLSLLKLQKTQNVYSLITLPNAPCLKLHEHFGFREVARFNQTGFKNGAWQDVVWLEKAIGDHSIPPEELRPFATLDSRAVAEIIAIHTTQMEDAL